jgi:hypothetical protein
MGHIRLGRLPRTRKWQQVVSLIDGGARTSAIAAATLKASENGLEGAAKDVALVHSFWLLTQLPLSARAENYPEELRKIGLTVSGSPSLMELVGAFSDSVDAHVRRTGGRTDIGEMGQMGAAECLAAVIGERSRSLFGTTTEDVQRALGGLATQKQFSDFSREFFARFTARYLTYFLSRELSNHVGPDRRFSTVDEHKAFSDALAVHCRQAARIVEQFAGGWYSKTNYEGRITERKAARFVHIALKKIRAELRKGAEGDEP